MANASSRAIVALAVACSLAATVPVAAQSVAPEYPRPAILPIAPRDVRPSPPVIVRPQPQQQGCPTGDCVSYNLSTQDECVMFDRQATGDQRWTSGLSLDVDGELFVERGQRQWNVQAYRIQWFNGTWSGWYVAGVNDLDHKYNPGPNTMRRMWSYFADHAHQTLACRRRQ